VSAPTPTGVRSRRRRWPWALGVAAVLIAWVVAAALLLLGVDRHVRDGIAAVNAAQGRINATTISDPNAPDLLAPVVADFGRARRDLDNPLLFPIRILPVAGRQVRAVRNLAAAAAQVGSIGETAIHQARSALHAPHATGPERVAAINQLADAASQADASLAKVSLGSRRALFGFVTRRYDDFATKLAKVRSGVHKGSIAARQTATLLNGPSHLLLLAANNAEMRDGSGMFLSATQVDISEGTVKIGAVSDTSDLVLGPGVVPLTGGYASVWGPYLADREWRNLGMSARFDETAALAAQMWKARTGNEVTGVMTLDIGGLQMLLAGTGPVNAGGRQVTTDNVVQLLMHDQYLSETGTSAATVARHEQLGLIAQVVVQAVQRGGFDTSAVARLLPAVVSGRHLMLWSTDPATEAGWETAGVAGVLADDSLLAAVQNLGSNKLDRFFTMTADVGVKPGASSAVTVVYHLANNVTPGQPAYIAGNGVAGVPPNWYYALVTLTMPGDADHVLVDGTALANDSGLDGPTRVVAILRKVAPSAKVDVTVTFTLPGAHGRLQVESAARIPAATVRVQASGRTRTVPDEQRPLLDW